MRGARPSTFATGQISGVCDDQYTATLERLQETGDEAFKLYLTRKTQGWFRRWGCPRTSAAASLPRTRRRPRRRWGFDAGEGHGACAVRRRGRCFNHLAGAERQRLAVITNLALGDVAIAGPGVGHTPSKTSRVQSAAFRSSLTSSSTPRLCQAPLACAIGYTHIEIICLQNHVNVGIDCDIIGEIIGEIMDVIICDIIGL
jgi:hypothetical protein